MKRHARTLRAKNGVQSPWQCSMIAWSEYPFSHVQPPIASLLAPAKKYPSAAVTCVNRQGSAAQGPVAGNGRPRRRARSASSDTRAPDGPNGSAKSPRTSAMQSWGGCPSE